jgi:hypothetical protein
MNIYLEIDNFISLIGNNGNGFSIELATVPFLLFVTAVVALRYGYKTYKAKKIRSRQEEALTALLGVGTPVSWKDGVDWHKKDRSCGCD